MRCYSLFHVSFYLAFHLVTHFSSSYCVSFSKLLDGVKLSKNQMIYQGWARDVNARDRDETETLTSRDRDVGFTSRDETETRR